MAGRKKKEHRQLATRLAVFPGLAYVPSREEEIGLDLNIPRIRLFHAVATAHGIEASLSDGRLDRAWFEALCEHPEMVDVLEFETNTARQVAKASNATSQPW